jgi:hypothetical protein
MSAHLCFWVLFLEVHESPSHYFFWRETARPQIGLWQKIRVNPNYLVVFFTVATPTLSTGAESAESMIVSAPLAESIILSALFGHVITLTAAI